jgi:uncharacterized protein
MRNAIIAAAFSLFAILPATAAEEAVRFASGDHELAGTLSLPDGAGPHTAVVLISGSGRSDRDESLPGVALKPFEVIAEHLSSNGIAVLRYDDRGVGESSGDFLSATSSDFADDALAAVAYLAARPEINARRMGLLGHSEGGVVAAIAATRAPEAVGFVIAVASPAVPGYELMRAQFGHILQVQGIPEEQREAIIAQQFASLDLTVAGDWAGVEAYLRARHAAAPEGDVETFVREGLIYHRGWLRFFATYDPAPDFAALRMPVLALYGDRDVQVLSALNAPKLEAALAAHDDAMIIRLPTGNHLFQDALSGEMDEYATLPAAFVPEFLSTISDWIAARF